MYVSIVQYKCNDVLLLPFCESCPRMNISSLVSASGEPTDFDCSSISNFINVFVASNFTSCLSTDILTWPVYIFCNITYIFCVRLLYVHGSCVCVFTGFWCYASVNYCCQICTRRFIFSFL